MCAFSKVLPSLTLDMVDFFYSQNFGVKLIALGCHVLHKVRPTKSCIPIYISRCGLSQNTHEVEGKL